MGWDYPWSVATQLHFSYELSTAGSTIQLLSGSGQRTFTNRFGTSTTTSLTLAPPNTSGSDNLLYLHSTVPVDTSGLTWTMNSPVQLPGVGPLTEYSSLRCYNTSTGVVESGESRVDPLGQAFLSAVPGFVNVSIGASNINALAPVYGNCAAPISFSNGLRPPTQPSSSNGALQFRYSYYISDGQFYSVSANLTITTSSPFATATDQLGNPHQVVVNITGTRLYTYFPTSSTWTSAVTGLMASSTASQRFYPYSLLASAPGVYSSNSAPFLDANGIEFALSPPIPFNGIAPNEAPYSPFTSLYILTPNGGTPVLTEGLYQILPLATLQQQYYTLL